MTEPVYESQRAKITAAFEDHIAQQDELARKREEKFKSIFRGAAERTQQKAAVLIVEDLGGGRFRFKTFGEKTAVTALRLFMAEAAAWRFITAAKLRSEIAYWARQALNRTLFSAAWEDGVIALLFFAMLAGSALAGVEIGRLINYWLIGTNS